MHRVGTAMDGEQIESLLDHFLMFALQVPGRHFIS